MRTPTPPRLRPMVTGGVVIGWQAVVVHGSGRPVKVFIPRRDVDVALEREELARETRSRESVK